MSDLFSDTGPQNSPAENTNATQPDYLVHFCSSLPSPFTQSYLILLLSFFLSFFLFSSSTQLLLLFTFVVLWLLLGFVSMFTICKIELVGSCYSISILFYYYVFLRSLSIFLASSSKYVFLHHLVLISFWIVKHSLHSYPWKNKPERKKKQSH